MSDRKIIVHVGAGNGEEYFKRKWLKDGDIRIILFEPIPHLACFLRKKFQGWGNVKIFQSVLTNETRGRVRFWMSENIAGSSIFGEKNNLKNPVFIEVHSYDAGEFLNLLSARIALNLNCEGSEFLILPRVTEENLWGKIEAIRIEWHHQAHRLPQFESEYIAHIRLLSDMNKQVLNQNEWFEFVKGWT